MRFFQTSIICFILFRGLTAHAQRQPILPQIDVPHDYYYREMYLPQLTSGPSSVCWSPDGRSLVYSMAGTLWKQNVGDTVAVQLTSGSGYDYQPDWSPDGKQIVFTRYTGMALELQLLNLETKSTTTLTNEGNVNVEPRFSPDGKQIAFVSTKDTRHFRIWIGELNANSLTSHPLSPERQTTIERYYYSQYDHQLSPSWSPDGKSLMMVSNPDVIYGTGNIYKVKVDGQYDPVPIQQEETTWKTKPDWSNDGKRVVYSSYLGRQWHQLWLTTAGGEANPYPITYGNHDVTAARWSHDGNKIAFISNETGNTSLWILNMSNSAIQPVRILIRKYLNPMTELSIRTKVNDQVVPSRISITDSNGKSYFPNDAWVHADDGFDRSKQKFESHYFHSLGEASLDVPPGKINIKVFRGLEYGIIDTTIVTTSPVANAIELKLKSLSLPNDWGKHWISGDVHVHMNYGGTYRNTPYHLVHQAEAEDLDLVFNTIVNKEQRIIDLGYFTPYPDPASNEKVLLLHGQEYHTSYWGHLGLLGLNDHFLLPGYSSYPGTAIASPYPSNSRIADLGHTQKALVGYVHPFYDPPDPTSKSSISHELPVDVALGKVDYYEVVGFSWHKESASVWYRLLNCGFRLTAAGGTDAMANYASLRGPVGMNRVYVNVENPSDEPEIFRNQWLQNFKAGKTLATNGPLLGFTINGNGPGSELKISGKKQKVNFSGFLSSIVPVDHLEIVMNGKVIKSFDVKGKSAMKIVGNLTIDKSGWLLLRAWNDGATPDIYDLYPYATTNPVYIIQNDKPIRSAEDAQYFIQWIDKVKESATRHAGYLNEMEKEKVLDDIQQARKVFELRK